MGKYSILKGHPTEYNNTSDDNHIFIRTTAAGYEHSIAINVCSNKYPRCMYYALKKFYYEDFRDSTPESLITTTMINAPIGLKTIKSYDEFKLSYKEQNWFVEDEMLIASRKSNPNNILGRKVINLTKASIAADDSFVCAFGISWGPKPAPDRSFGFYPTRGIHDVHCNIENGHDTHKTRPFSVHDGALFFHFPSEGFFYGIFCMFPGQLNGSSRKKQQINID